jgi:hypothetical protein
MQVSPIQCGGNTWEVWHRDLNRVYIRAPTEREILTEWLSATQGITVRDFAQKPAEPGTVVCEACSCGRGDRIAVLVSAQDAQKLTAMSSIRWTQIGNADGIACTMDARICPDGSAAGRTAPFCEFTPCAPIDLSDVNIFIEKQDLPGFILNPKTVTRIIRNDGSFSVKTEEYARAGGSVKTSVRDGNRSRAELEGLAKAVLATDFFDVNSDAAGWCIADIPTERLDVTIGNRHNVVGNIGAECESEMLAQTKELLVLIEAYTTRDQNGA